MTYRMFGETGEKISSLGFGCMRLPEVEQDGVWSIDDEKAIPMLQKAYELGVILTPRRIIAIPTAKSPSEKL